MCRAIEPVCLGLTEKCYQSSEVDVRLAISKQGDAIARHYLYEGANMLLTTERRPTALTSWGLAVQKGRGAKRARVAVARKLGFEVSPIRSTTTSIGSWRARHWRGY